MRWNILGFLVLLAVATSIPEPALGQAWQEEATTKPSLSLGTLVGFQNGLSFQVVGRARDFAQGLPVHLRLRLGRTSVEPGNPLDARRVFINDATNGTPKESGRTWDMGLDAILPLGERTGFFGGVRYTSFTANFNFVGGNEDFDVTSSHWGLAAGLEASYPMSQRMTLLVQGGGEYFFSGRIAGHDTSYSPDGDDVNPRRDYTFDEADEAVDQPTWRPIVLLGVSYRMGG